LITACLPPSEIEIQKAIHQTQTAEFLNKPKPTRTALPTKTICNVNLDIKKEWKTVFCDQFSDNRNKWWTGADMNTGATAELINGKYILGYNSQNQTGYTTGFTTALNFFDAQDFAVTLTGQINSKFKNCQWGIIVRGDYQNGYGFTIDNQGNYYFTYEGSKTNRYIGNIKTGSNSAIKWNRPNTISALVEGRNITYYVNDEPIIAYEADNAINKEISWKVWAAEGVTASFEFDDLLVREK
jgi:hypothetical protein